MLNNKKILVILISMIFSGATLLILFIGNGPVDPRLGLMLVVALQSAILLGLLGGVYVLGRRSKIAAESLQPLKVRLEVLDRITQGKLEQLSTSLLGKLDSLERASQARFLRIDQRLGRQGRRVEAIYGGIQPYLVPMDSTSDGAPLLTQINATNELLDRANISLVSLRAEVDRGSKRLREHSGHLRQLLTEQSKISSNKVLLAQAAVIEELLEGMDSIIRQSHRNEI